MRTGWWWCRPGGRAAAVAALARQIDHVEAQIREEIASGKTSGLARQALGYHELQRKRQ